MGRFLIFVSSVLALYISFVLLLYLFQRSLIYHPSINNYLKDGQANEPTEIEKVKINTVDNIDLVAWFYNKDIKKLKTILFFHGNAGSLNKRTYKLNHFKNLDVNFLIIAWRGFSGNEGKPNAVSYTHLTLPTSDLV